MSNHHWAILACTSALSSTLLFFILSSSQEFGAFSPFPMEMSGAYFAAFLIGVTLALVTHGIEGKPRLGIAFFAFFVPITLYGGALVLVWTGLTGTILLDYFILHAGYRVLVYIGTVGLIGAIGMFFGVLAADFILPYGFRL